MLRDFYMVVNPLNRGKLGSGRPIRPLGRGVTSASGFGPEPSRPVEVTVIKGRIFSRDRRWPGTKA
jgi:hypothetical protein